MIVTRFCSKEEYAKFQKGKVLENHTEHKRQWAGSSAKGFCFSADPPKEAWKYLKGIVRCDVCMVLEIEDYRLRKVQAKYRNTDEPGLFESMLVDEYCLERYSNECAILLQVLAPEEFATPDDIEACRWLGLMEGVKTGSKITQSAGFDAKIT